MSERRPWLDGWRGAAFWLMVLYHLLYDLYLFGYVRENVIGSLPMAMLEKAVAWSFILCAGISSRLSCHNFRRGLVLLFAGGAVTAVSWLVGMPIRFGILQFFGVSLMLCAAFGGLVDRLPSVVGAPLWLALFCVFSLTFPAIVGNRWLFWLGLYYDGFLSYDYFPLLPYLFLMLLGRAMEPLLPKTGGELPQVLMWSGRHSLLLYLVHQPVLYLICAYISKFECSLFL